MDHKYSLVFAGVLKSGIDKAAVIERLAQDYQKDGADFEAWFSDEETILRHEASFAEAQEIRQYFDHLGMVVQARLIEPVSVQEESALPVLDNGPKLEVANDSEARINDAMTQLEAALTKVEGRITMIRPARLSLRALAFVFDMIILSFILTFLLKAFLGPMGLVNIELINTVFLEISQKATTVEINQALMEQMNDAVFRESMTKMLYISLISFTLYFGVLDSKWRGSLGKRLFKLQVFSLKSSRLSLLQGFARAISFVVGFELTYLIAGLIGQPQLGQMLFFMTLLVGLFDPKRLNQTLYDRFTASCVGYRNNVS